MRPAKLPETIRATSNLYAKLHQTLTETQASLATEISLKTLKIQLLFPPSETVTAQSDNKTFAKKNAPSGPAKQPLTFPLTTPLFLIVVKLYGESHGNYAYPAIS